MARRGFFAEMQYQNQLAAKRQIQAQRAYARALATAQREADQARRQSERAAAEFARASIAQQKAMQKEAKRLREAAQTAEVVSLNAQVAELADQLGSILQATLEVDDYVDLERFRVEAQHPAFARDDLEVLTPPAEVIATPAEPALVAPAVPTGLASVFGGSAYPVGSIRSV